MTEFLFYHLTQSTLEEALPPMLERSIDRGWRAVVQLGSEERLDALDQHLWTYRDDSFLAHATDREAHAAEQPILLTTRDDNPNGAAVRFLVDGAGPPDLTAYERAAFLFDGHDQQAVEAVRRHWKAARAAGHAVTYWQQAGDKRWERKA